MNQKCKYNESQWLASAVTCLKQHTCVISSKNKVANATKNTFQIGDSCKWVSLRHLVCMCLWICEKCRISLFHFYSCARRKPPKDDACICILLYLCIWYFFCISANEGFHCFTDTHVQEENHPRMMHVTKLVASLRHSGVEWFQKVLDLRKFHIAVPNNVRWFVEKITYFDMPWSMSWKFSNSTLLDRR